MITVEIKKDGILIGHIQMDRFHDDSHQQGEEANDFDSYRIMYRVWRGADAAHRRIIYGFPRKYFNVFALVLQALNALNEKDLKLERDFDPDKAPVSADLGRGLNPTMREVQAGERKLHRD